MSRAEFKKAKREWYADWLLDLKTIADIRVDEHERAKCVLCSKTVCAEVSATEDWATHQRKCWPFIVKTSRISIRCKCTRTATRTTAALSATNAWT